MAKHHIGVLVLHGFASSLDSIEILNRPLQLLNLPVRMPVLRGHGAKSPDALHGITWRDWVSDAEKGLRSLLTDADKAVIVGHGMGALLALILATNSRDSVVSLVLAAPSIALPNPTLMRMRLQVLFPAVQRTFPRWRLPPSYTDKNLRKGDTNYRWAPMDALLSFFELIDITRSRLVDVRAPVFILQGYNDGTLSPDGPAIIRAGISTPNEQKRIRWFKKTDHEMFRDCEREAVTEAVVDYVMTRLDGFSH